MGTLKEPLELYQIGSPSRDLFKKHQVLKHTVLKKNVCLYLQVIMAEVDVLIGSLELLYLLVAFASILQNSTLHQFKHNVNQCCIKKCIWQSVNVCVFQAETRQDPAK